MGPDRTAFDVEAVRAAVASTRFTDLRWVGETGSTNADLSAVAADGGGEGIVLGADHQTAGRGRRGRTWTAPPGAAVLVSVLLRPPAPVVELATPAVALAAAEAVERVCGRAPGIKWPNDLVVAGQDGSDRKLAGVLAEASWPAGVDIASGWRSPAPSTRVPVVMGLGLNVRAEGRDPDLEGLSVACDELAAPGTEVGREALVAAWLLALDGWYERIRDPEGRDQMWAAWRERSATLGRQVRVDLGTDDLVGEAVDVTSAGQLVVRTLEGEERVLAVGDVTHLRAV